MLYARKYGIRSPVGCRRLKLFIHLLFPSGGASNHLLYLSATTGRLSLASHNNSPASGLPFLKEMWGAISIQFLAPDRLLTLMRAGSIFFSYTVDMGNTSSHLILNSDITDKTRGE